MATTTTNLGLTKPAYTETADISVINSNMDTIDSAIKTLQDTTSTHTSQISALQDSVGCMDVSFSTVSPDGTHDAWQPTLKISDSENSVAAYFRFTVIKTDSGISMYSMPTVTVAGMGGMLRRTFTTTGS